MPPEGGATILAHRFVSLHFSAPGALVEAQPMQIGMQLYSGRNFPLTDVLRITAAAGYAEVEGYDGLYADAPRLKALLDQHGLRMPSAHIGYAALKDHGAAVKLARALSVELIVCPILPARRRPVDADGWRKIGAELEALALFYKGEGLSLGYHNHDFEFVRLGGLYGIDLMTAEAPSLLIEADLAWIARGGADPFTWIAENGARIAAAHVKDLAPPGQTEEGGWADVGYGVMPWSALALAIKQQTGARYFVAEHDNPRDFERFAHRSIANIRIYVGAGDAPASG
jgi:sugar phosphate isomerase/epimerase